MIANSSRLKLFFLCSTVLITLFFGLYPKDFGISHRPFINEDGDLGFTKYSIATANVSLTGARDTLSPNIALTLSGMPVQNSQFSVIHSINDSQDYSDLLLGQWENYLVIMSGDDYPNRSKQPRITISLDSIKEYTYPQTLRIFIQATQTATTVYINGQQVAQSSEYIVRLEPDTYIIALGNSLNRKHGWTGTIREFELAVPNNEIVKFARNSKTDQPPKWMLHPALFVLGSEWLSTDALHHYFTSNFKKDVLINLLGFIPVSLAIFIFHSARIKPIDTTYRTIAITSLFSLFIESTQILIPSRTSSIVDLAVNSLAGVITAMLCYIIIRWSIKQSE